MELKNFGWNLLTIGFCGTIFFTLFAAWGLWQQAKKIWLNKSGLSVSVFWFSYNIFLFSANIVYGYSINSLALVFNGVLLSLMHFPVLIGLAKFKGFKPIQKWLFVLYLGLIVLLIALPIKSQMYLLFSFVNIIALITQPWEIMKNKNSGMVEIKLIVVYLASTLFWVAYAFAIKDWALQIICPAYLIIWIATLILWVKYK
ncbi:MAG: hypothetical protein A2Y82_03035 [Candidatus Buchananbacteria bacterium RBG_13_36_9]|uniref:Uncharacterized protein n=1 Tax=Candidatus Buchananbacteria bacterium RBG_13_36_9 TaxID=1797530 RepID=A0A1G1XRD4_9BACT|nr:MAG: hypothetical protein A2Y82_03035 [Candidatus Buchananbacteria bacterium RBG_13_36_9]